VVDTSSFSLSIKLQYAFGVDVVDYYGARSRARLAWWNSVQIHRGDQFHGRLYEDRRRLRHHLFL
jgi:hypothetical protein